MNVLLILSAYLSTLVYKPNFANGTSVLLLMTIGPSLLGSLMVILALVDISLHPYPFFWILLLGLAFWFGDYAKRFAQAHKTEIVARSQTLPWPRISAGALFVFAFLLFAGLVKTAAWIDGQS
jgi:hypothetical protein